MKYLKNLLPCHLKIRVAGLKSNSKEVKKHDLFLCTTSSSEKKENMLDAVKRKACAIITQSNNYTDTNIPFFKVNNIHETAFNISRKFYDIDLDKIKLIGVTGTDGKTTTATIISDLMSNFLKTGYLGTNGFKVDNYIDNISNTTLPIEKTMKYIRQVIDKNGKYLVMEVSSEGLFYKRCEGLTFDVGILTNITKDHMNTHLNLDNYIECKSRMFKMIKKDGISIINRDDKHYKKIKNACSSNIITYGKSKSADVRILDIKTYSDYTSFSMILNEKKYKIHSPLLGDFNVYNLVCAIVTINYLGIDMIDIIDRIKLLKQVPGRLQSIELGQKYKIIIDYAHTVNATREILKFYNKIKMNKIITVLGCAGGRDKSKRSDIGKIATDFSDLVIFTMDDPRNESINDIMKDITCKIKKKNYSVICNRSMAIKKAIDMAREDDIILILGKGNDHYMALGDKKVYYSDEEEIVNYIKK